MPLLLPPLLNIARRIHDGKGEGVALVEGGKGRMEDCQIWGNERAGVVVRGNGSEAVVAGCKCAGGRAGSLIGGSRIPDSANPFPLPLCLRVPPPPHGRIHDGKCCGVAFAQGGEGRVEDCQIWGNKLANVHVQDSGSQAAVKGCECAKRLGLSRDPLLVL